MHYYEENDNNFDNAGKNYFNFSFLVTCLFLFTGHLHNFSNELVLAEKQSYHKCRIWTILS